MDEYYNVAIESVEHTCVGTKSLFKEIYIYFRISLLIFLNVTLMPEGRSNDSISLF